MAKKAKNQKLEIYQNGEIVGQLDRAANGAIKFQYAPTWLDKDLSLPVSLSLPLREEAFRGSEASYYFDNLLPDNDEIRSKIAGRVGAESQATFDLLSAIGHDCVGSLQFLLPDTKPQKSPSIKTSQALKKSEIAKILRDLKLFPLGMQSDEPDFRLSIAGVQEKTALLKKQKDWFKPLSNTPSTHILKPPMGTSHNGIDLSDSVENEWLSMRVCRELGLMTANCEMQKFGEQKCLSVERFDREWKSSKTLIRLPQEDICQALGISSSKKYQAEGGPGIVKIMNFLNGSDERNQDRSTFMRAQIVFFLLAATDGHAKNFSVFLTPSGFRLTPLYDVMSAFPAATKKQFQLQKAKLAMSVSKHYKIRDIARRHFQEAAKASGFSTVELQRIIDELKTSVPQLADKIKLPSQISDAFADSIFDGMVKNLKRL